MSRIAANIEAVQHQIEAAAQRAGRRSEDITLIAVTKTHPLETVREAYHAGIRHLGENRSEEGQQKVSDFKAWLEPEQEVPKWHFIGYLQSRQANNVVGSFDIVHSVDRLKLARRINRLAKRDKIPPVEVLLQCNVSGERRKAGFELDQWQTDKEQLAAFLEKISQIEKLDKVIIRGLMTMAPFVDDPEETRPVFQKLAALRGKLQTEMSHISWPHLSMGMTNDFEVAIEEGATMIRVGRALFGERQQG